MSLYKAFLLTFRSNYLITTFLAQNQRYIYLSYASIYTRSYNLFDKALTIRSIKEYVSLIAVFLRSKSLAECVLNLGSYKVQLEGNLILYKAGIEVQRLNSEPIVAYVFFSRCFRYIHKVLCSVYVELLENRYKGGVMSIRKSLAIMLAFAEPLQLRFDAKCGSIWPCTKYYKTYLICTLWIRPRPCEPHLLNINTCWVTPFVLGSSTSF